MKTPTTSLAIVLFLVTAAVSFAAEPDDQDPFLAPPRHIGSPRLPDHAPTNRAFQGIPSMAVSPGGRLWADWYAGVTPREDHNNYVVVSSSGDHGRSWKEVLVIDPDGSGPVRAFDPELWQAPNGRLFVFWAQAAGHEGTVAGVWCIHTDHPDDEKPKWSKPRRLTDGIMMCKPVVLTSGEWVLPASTWRKTDASARMIVSTDQGKTWSMRGACNVPSDVRAFDEHIITERRDGSLWLLARTKYGIGESVSTDRGVTWPDLKPSAIPHPSARFFVRRLKSGKLLLVKHGAIDKRRGRSHLTAYVSADDGKTWTGGLLLDERAGVSYPDGQQTDDGLIRIIYDFSRTGTRHILMATFREQDVAEGKPVSDDVQLRKVVSEAARHQSKSIEGWTVLVSDQLLEKEKAATERALELLTVQLKEITRVVPAAAVVELRKVPLWFSPQYPGVQQRAEYHPGAGWLRDNKRNPAMEKAVEFTNVRIFERETKRMPNFALHELAHAYHDRVLPKGFGNEEIKAAFKNAKAKGLYEKVEQRFGNGRSARVRAYAITNPMEYFAESTEAFFSTNDFFPFTRKQLEKHDPQMFALLKTLWSRTADGKPSKPAPHDPD